MADRHDRRRTRPGILAHLSLRYWRKRPGRALVSLSGIALGVALMVGVVSVNQAVLRTYDGWAAAIAGRDQVEVRSVASSGLSAAWRDKLLSLPGVSSVAGVVEQRSYLFTDATQASVELRGVDPLLEPDLRPVALLAGEPLTAGDHGVVNLSQAAADSLEVGVGDAVSLLTALGVVDLRVVGIHRTVEAGVPPRDRTAVIPLTDAQEAFMQGRDVVTRFDVVVADPTLLAGLRSDLDSMFDGSATIRLPADELRELVSASRGLRFLLLLSGAMALVAAAFLIATNLFAAVEERARDVDVLRAIGLPGTGAATWLLVEAACLGLVGSLLGAVAGAGLAGTLLGRLPTVLLAGVEAVPRAAVPTILIAAIGVAVGVEVAVLAAAPLARRSLRQAGPNSRSNPTIRSGRAAGLALSVGSRLSPPAWRWPVALRWPVAWRWATVSLLLAALLLALSRWQPGASGTVMRSDPLSTAQLQALLAAAVVCLLGWAAVRSFPLLLGRLGDGVRHLDAPPVWLRLAADSLKRHSRRSGATAISLMITVAGLVGVYGAADSYRASLAAWLDATVSWDLLVSSGPGTRGSSTPLPTAVADVVASVDGVRSALPERSVTVASAGRAVQLVAFDAGAPTPSRALRAEAMVSGLRSDSVSDALTGRDAVALAAPLAARLGLEPGDHVPLSTPSGERSFLVVGVVEDPAADRTGMSAAAAYIDIESFAAAWDDSTVDEVGVRLEQGADPARAAAAVAAAVRHSLGRGANSRAAQSLDAGPSTPEVDPRVAGDAGRDLGGLTALGAGTGSSAALDAAATGLGPVQVIHATAYREEVLDGVRDTFAITRTLVLVAVMVALAGLLNAVLIGFWQLRHQLGLLRALGAPVQVLTRTLAAEAALTTIAGGGAGVLLGTLLSVAFLRGMDYSSGPLLVWSPPVQAYVTVAGLLTIGAVLATSLLESRVRATPVQAVLRGE